MMLIKWWLFFVVIPAIGGSRKFSESNGIRVGEEILKILLESCYKNENSSNPILIFGNYDESINGSSIIRINNSFNIDENYKTNELLNYKASKIVLIKDTPEKLQSDLTSLKKTKWWNHMASFFIIGKNNEECENFRDILVTTWQMDIINSIFICSESKNTSELYTLNPLANYAPHPWERMEKLDDLNVFRQFFHSDVSCKNLNYDKTKVLNGYEIRAMRRADDHIDYVPEKNYFDSDQSRIMMRFIHATIKASNASCKLELESNTHTMIERLKNNSLDFSLWSFALEEYPGKSFLNSYSSSNIIAIIKLSSEIPTLYKIFHLWSSSVLVGAVVVLTTFFSILAIMYCNFSSALLDVIRLLTYVTIRIDVRSHSFRIYFTTILIFMVISNGVFQGKIASFLTKPERFGTIESIDKLIELRYKFYTYEDSEGTIESQCPECGIISVPNDACIDYVRNGSLNACVVDDAWYEANWSQFPVEPIKKPLGRVFWKHLCRDDWPLHDHMNVILSGIMESGIYNFWEQRMISPALRKRQARDHEQNLAKYRPVRLVKLDFAFQLLAVGLSFAIGSFFIESLVAEYRNP